MGEGSRHLDAIAWPPASSVILRYASLIADRERPDRMKPHERLDHVMNERRLELGMRWNELAEVVGIKPESMRAIRRGDYGPSELTARRIDAALHWSPGSTQRVLTADGDPVPLVTEKREMTTSEMIAAGYRDLNELERLDEELHRRMLAARRSPQDLEKAVTALRLVQGELDENGQD